MSITCIGPHDTDPPLTDGTLLLCLRCYGRLTRALADVTSLWPLLAVMLEPGNGASSGAGGKPGSRPPCNLDIVDITDARSETSQQLVSWARVVIEDRRLSPRSLDGEQAARLLAIHATWLAAQPFADEALDEIATAAYRIRRACRDLPEPPIGKCPDIDPNGQRDTCGGPLRWIDDGTMSVVCGRCGSGWDEESLIYVGRVSPLNVWDTVPRIAEMLDAPERTVRRWAAAGKVRKNAFGQVRHSDVWRMIATRSEPPAAAN